MNFDWEPRNDKQNYAVCISVSRDNGKFTQKDFKSYHYHYGWRYGAMLPKCGFWGMFNTEFNFDTECSTVKKYGFWVLWGIFKECIEQNIIMAVLRKVNSHSVVICRLVQRKKQ